MKKLTDQIVAKIIKSSFGGIGRHVRLKIWFYLKSIGSSPVTSILKNFYKKWQL
jgi:hypothetical protein